MKIRSTLAAAIVSSAALAAQATTTELFHETFDGNDQNWSYTSTGARSYDKTWTEGGTVKPGYKGVKLGSTSDTGSITSEVFPLDNTSEDVVITVVAAAYSNNGGGKEGIALTVYNSSGSSIYSGGVAELTQHTSTTKDEILANQTYTHTFTVPATDLPSSGGISLKIESTYTKTGQRRALIGDVLVTQESSSGGGGGDEPPAPVALAVPAGLSASEVDDTGFSLAWEPVENADGYSVEVKDSNGNDAGSVSYDSTTATVTGLSQDTTYTVRVKTLAAAGSEDYVDSDWSQAISVTTNLPDGLAFETVFDEPFSGSDNNSSSWASNASIVNNGSFIDNITTNIGWTASGNLRKAPGAILFGTSSVGGTATTPDIFLRDSGPEQASVEVSFRGAKKNDTFANSMIVSVVSSLGTSNVTVSLPEIDTTSSSDMSGITPLSFRVLVDSPFKVTFREAQTDARCYLDDVVIRQIYDPDYAALTVPANVAVSDIGKTSFTVSWGEVTDASGYEVWLNGAMADSCASTDTSISLTGLSDGTAYAVQVRALGDGLHKGDSALSTAVSATTLEDAQKIVFAVTGAPDGEVYAGDAVSFTVTAAEETSGDAASVAFSGISGATFNSATGAFSWTPTEADVGSRVATFTSGLYSTNVTISVVSAWTTETVATENFSTIPSTSWTSYSGYATNIVGDIGTWTGLDIIKTKAAIIIGRVASAGSARSPAIGLKPGATGVSVSFDTGALPNMADDLSAAVKVSLLDAETGTALATETFSNLPKLAADAQAVSDANAHYVLSLPAGTTVPESVVILFESIHENTSHSGRVYVDTVVVSQTVSAKIKTLASPDDLALSGSAGENGFTVTWTPVEGATGYEVRVLDASAAAAGSPSGGVSPAGTVWAGLDDDSAYTVQVRATGNAATHYPSAWSEAVSVTTARSALHPTLSLGAWQNEVGNGALYASTANSATVSATLAGGAPGTVTSIALSSVTPAQAEGATGPTLAGGTLAWTPAEADAKKSFTLAFAVTVTPVEGEARIWTETVAVPVAALPDLAAPANLAVDPETLDWNRADFTWTKPFRAVSYTLRVWSGAADPDASGTTWSEDFASYPGVPPAGWTFDNNDADYASYNGVHVGFKASGSVTSPDISGSISSLSFKIRSVSGVSSTLTVSGQQVSDGEWVELESYTDETLSTSTTTKTIDNLAGAYNRFKWEFVKKEGNLAFGSVVLTGTGLPTAKIRTVEIASGDTTAATAVPAAWGEVNYADITAYDANGASQTSSAILFTVPEQPQSVRATLMVFK